MLAFVEQVVWFSIPTNFFLEKVLMEIKLTSATNVFHLLLGSRSQ